MKTISLLLLSVIMLRSMPPISHDDRSICVRQAPERALQGAPSVCLHEAVQRMERQLERIERRYPPSK